MKFSTFLSLSVSLLAPVSAATNAANLTPSQRAQQILDEMTTDEKLDMLHGFVGTYVGNVVGNDRLGIPAIHMQDGPQGFRVTGRTGEVGSTTAWPSALSAASSWDEDLIYRWTKAMGNEFKMKGANVALAPGIGMARVPTAGRNFEYLCGEDPFLGAKLAYQSVTGIQENGIIANAKHWVNNEIEESRKTVSADVSERARFELYYPPFEAAVEAGVLSVMCSYNRVNDVYACENDETLNNHLRTTLNFNGWVMSDWYATHSTSPSLNGGLDMEMPMGMWLNNHLVQRALDNGEVTIETINEKILRVLTAMYTIGLFDEAPVGNPTANVTSAEHAQLAREIGAKSSVLLKNDNSLLPLTAEKLFAKGDRENCIAVFGDESTVSGGGSGHVDPGYVITPTQGIQSALAQIDASSVPVYYNTGSDLNSVASLAAKCQYAVVVVATTSKEASDRPNLSLDGNQDDLVSAVAAANKDGVIVSVRTPGAVLMPWADEVSSVVVSWLPGQEAGNALADILFGFVNPSGRLPVTMPNIENEVGFTKRQYPGIRAPGKPFPDATYSEELLIGYRWYHAKNVTPRFAFGHGLSYTSFGYSQLEVAPSTKDTELYSVQFTLENTGALDGDDIPQLYLTFPLSANEPPRQLKGFKKVFLKQKESETVTFSIKARDVSIWDEETHAWTKVNGKFGISIGTSSADIRLTGSFKV